MSGDEGDETLAGRASVFQGAGGLRVGRHEYAVGLLWNAADPKKIRAEAAREAKDVGANLFLPRKEAGQFALGSTAEGHSTRQASLAASLADAVDGSFVGIFPAGDSAFYLVGVRNGTVLATLDRLIEGRDAAVDEFSVLQAEGMWDYTFAPASFGFDRSKDQSLEDVLAGFKPKSRLQPLSNKGLLLKAGAALLAAGLIFLLYGQFQAWQEAREQERMEREAQEAEEAVRQAEQARLAAAEQLRVVIPPMPWAGRAFLADQFSACLNAIMSAPTEVPGWRVTTIGCGADGEVRMSLRRESGTGGALNWVAPFLTREGFRPRVQAVGQGGLTGQVDVSWPANLAALPRYSGEEVTAGISEARRHIVAHAEENFIAERVALTEVPGPTAEIMGPNNQPQSVPVSRGLRFTFNLQMPPEGLLPFLGQIPAAVLERLSVDMSDSRTWTWTIEGVSHERIPLPPNARPTPPRQPGAAGR